MDYSKENYVTIHSDPNVWKSHANYKILCHYKPYIKGVVADFGANHAACSLLLLENEAVTAIYPVDMNEKALYTGCQTAQALQPAIPVNFTMASLLNLPFGASEFDTIISFHTLEHIYPSDAQQFVSEVYRTLKVGGAFVISIPYDHAYPDSAHVAFYKEDTLRALFEGQGFETIECILDNRWDQKDLLTAVFVKRQHV